MRRSLPARWRRLIRDVRVEVRALVLVSHDARVPWPAKALALAVVAYALSPIDLVPDFIPVIGHLDDALLVPLGILLVRRLVPNAVLADCRRLAREGPVPVGAIGWAGAAAVALLWLGPIVWAVRALR